GGLRGEALVLVLVAVQHDVGPCGVERVPKRPLEIVDAPPRRAGSGREEARVVEIRQDAPLRAGGEVRLQPPDLRRSRPIRDHRVQGHDMPRTQIVAVVPLVTVARGLPEVIEVPGCGRRSVIVVAGYRPSPGLLPPPRRTV